MATSSSAASSSSVRSRQYPIPGGPPESNLEPSSTSADADAEEEDDGEEDDDAEEEEEAGPEDDAADSAASVPVDTLVTHLLAAKRALSSVTLVLRANDLVTAARRLHEESVILSAQTAFLRRGISEQVRVLLRVRRGLARAADTSKREFKGLIRTLDEANGRLEGTMEMLRETNVESVFRPAGEEPRSLLDFVDTDAVQKLQEAVKQCLGDLQAAQVSFDKDVLRFETDLRTLNKTMSSSPAGLPSPTSSNAYQPIPHLLASLTGHSHAMAQHLASLTRHFDMCVTAVRTTEGGAALARRRAAEAVSSSSQAGAGGKNSPTDVDSVSISGVIADVADLEPMSAAERAEIVTVVLQDAPEVDEVVAELNAVLHAMDADFSVLRDQADAIRAAHAATLAAFRVLRDLGARLPAYVAAEGEFLERWADENAAVAAKLGEMDELRVFYEGYASAYDSLILEAERRRTMEDKVRAVWRKARDGADKFIEADLRDRDLFRQEIGEFLPTDLWVGMDAPMRRWEVRQVGVGDRPEGEEEEAGSRSLENTAPALARNVVEAARERLGRTGGAR